MKRFQFRLATLLRLREATRDERRAQLAEAFAAERTLNDQKQQILDESALLRKQYERAANPGTLDVDRLLDAHRYQLILKAEMTLLEQQAAKLGEEIEKRRQALVAADREVRVLEKLRETWKERHQHEAALVEAKQIDEVANRMFVGFSDLERTV
jgi:flagellar FliJ protein